MNLIISFFWLCIMFSPFIVVLLIFFKKKKLHLNAKSLGSQCFFWFVVISPVILFVIFGFSVWKDYTLMLTKEGFDTFLEISKFPLAILTLSPALGVIVSNIHRTVQTNVQIQKTEKQIKLTSVKNNMDAFYAHHKYIIEGLSDIEIHNHYNYECFYSGYFKLKNIKIKKTPLNKFNVDEKVIIKDRRKLFSEVYKKQDNLKSNFIPELNKSFVNQIINHVNDMNFLLNSFKYSFSTKNNNIIIKLHESYNYEDFFDVLKVRIERLKTLVNIRGFLSLEYFYDFLRSDEYNVIFENKNNYEFDEKDYRKSIFLFIIFCEVTNKYIFSLSEVILKILELISTDPIYNMDKNHDNLDVLLKKIHDWNTSRFCLVPTEFYLQWHLS
ncbi:hypothetical protein [Xenorhabdus bovienii]|uniref:hypothetical protein n=1 Tax=Xenorhabdus bovienii TaxID=40576 RepID=UPI0023B231A0|nr:hypothetical protein [Xenorhabdus bovienii]MDE9552997.1 hypothetical protein [Xenorhabdus bovienii]